MGVVVMFAMTQGIVRFVLVRGKSTMVSKGIKFLAWCGVILTILALVFALMEDIRPSPSTPPIPQPTPEYITDSETMRLWFPRTPTVVYMITNSTIVPLLNCYGQRTCVHEIPNGPTTWLWENPYCTGSHFELNPTGIQELELTGVCDE